MSFHDYAPQDLPDDVTPAQILPDAESRDAPLPLPYIIRPRLRSILLTFLIHNNPFYLLSALCMIAGCYVLNIGLELRSGEIDRVLVLIGTLSVYELLLVGLGLFLIRSRGILRDGRTLLLLQIVFLVDLTFLNAETVTGDLRTGIAVNAVLLALALFKTGLVLKLLSPAFPWRSFAMAALMLTSLLALPCVLKAIEQDGRIDGLDFHTIWWCVGVLPVACEVIRFAGRRGEETAVPMRPRLSGLYITMGFVSLIAHLAMMHWVYKGKFYVADLTPVLLGLAVAAAYGRPVQLVPSGDLRLARAWLPIGAVLCALADPRPLDLSIGLGGRFELQSVHLAVLGAMAVYFYAYFWRWIRTLAVVSAATALMLLFGPTLRQIYVATMTAWQHILEFGWQFMPKTIIHWGITAVGAAFALLGLGAIISLSQPKQTIEEPVRPNGT